MKASDRGALDCHASHVDAVRRRMLAGVGAALMWPALGHGQTGRDVVDDAGRRVRVPARVSRVLAAGAPASILVFAVAPDKLIGWTSPLRP